MMKSELPKNVEEWWPGVYRCLTCDVFTPDPESHRHMPSPGLV